MKTKIFILSLFFAVSTIKLFAQCTPNAGLDAYACGQTCTLQGQISQMGSTAMWTSNYPGVVFLNPAQLTVTAEIPSFSGASTVVSFILVETNGGCSGSDTVVVTFYQIPNANAGLDTSECGKVYNLEGVLSNANNSGTWSMSNTPPNPGSANFIPPTSPTTTVTVTEFGYYYFVWKEMNINNTTCFDRDTVRVEFKVQPMPDAGLDTMVCGIWANLCATPSVPGGQWSCPQGGIAYYDAINGNFNASYKDSACTTIRYGATNNTVMMFWFENNGVCTGYDTVNIFFGSIQPAISLVGVSDSISCGPSFSLLSAQQPAFGYGYWMDTVQNTTYTPSPINNTPVATIDTGGVDYYGWHNFYFITVNGICRDTSVVVPVKFIKNPVANAGAHHWPGLFGPVCHNKTDTVCGLAYQMSAIPSIGAGHWYFLDPTNIHFGTSTGPQQSTVPNDSVYLTLGYSVFNPIKYREFVWQENNNGCVNSDTLRLYSAPIPSGQFAISPPTCPQNNFNIIAHTWPLPNNVDYGITNFEWIYPNGIMDPTITNPTSSDTVLINWPSGNQHYVSLVTTNQWGCSSILNSQTLNEPASGRIIGQLSSSTLVDYSAYEINLYKAQVNTEALIVDTVSLTSLGDFNFEVFGAGNFYVKANLLNPNNIIPYTNSYYNNAWEWSGAQIVTLSCEDTVNLNFQLYGYTPANGGSGTISGKVGYDLSNAPVADAFVYLQYKPTDEPALIAKTNTLGEYTMSGIPMGNYRMTCEIPGLPQITTHHLVFSPANYIYTNVNFIVDSSTISKNYGFGIYADTTGFIGVSENLTDEYEFAYFPNPASDVIKVIINNNVIENTILTIYNIEGKKLIEKIISQPETIVDINSLCSGIYTIEIKNDKIIRRDKLIKK